MKKIVGSVLVVVLVVIATVVMFSGAIRQLFLAGQSTEATQQFVEPDKPVSKWPFTTYGKLENQKQKLGEIKAKAGLAESDLDKKLKESEAAYEKLIGSTSNPGLIGSLVLTAFGVYATNLYKNQQAKLLYTEEEYQTGISKAVNGNKITPT